ncbi:hypothetical protein [Selenomonas sp.]|uniref:hypothetical protein n=1 Tax=Selenomonas sp. TaxID=2053611 RepID=UPI0025E182F6|nr:hypothetical protein [Selenomonas sp.]MDY3297157.1 hypothetical protein [Selenomonas sp.]
MTGVGAASARFMTMSCLGDEKRENIMHPHPFLVHDEYVLVDFPFYKDSPSGEKILFLLVISFQSKRIFYSNFAGKISLQPLKNKVL